MRMMAKLVAEVTAEVEAEEGQSEWLAPLCRLSELGVALLGTDQMAVQEIALASTPEIGRPFATDFSSQLPPAAR